MTDSTVHIDVKVRFLPEQSAPDQSKHVFAYTITIANHGNETCQLISRHWKITDERGDVKEVSGMGVVGEQPTLKPGESYTYSSGCILETPTGTMEGTYHMRKKDGSMFDATIPTFGLVPPHLLH